MTKEKIKEKENEIIKLTDSFADEYLTIEYRELFRKLTKKMGRKREVPFVRGKVEIWAASVVYAIGSINFLFGDSKSEEMNLDMMNDFFKTKKSTTSNKGSEIKKMLKIDYFDKEFTCGFIQEHNPANNFVEVDGYMVPLDRLPPDVQDLVRRTRAEGKEITLTTTGD